jgi:hypothetical protein
MRPASYFLLDLLTVRKFAKELTECVRNPRFRETFVCTGTKGQKGLKGEKGIKGQKGDVDRVFEVPSTGYIHP